MAGELHEAADRGVRLQRAPCPAVVACLLLLCAGCDDDGDGGPTYPISLSLERPSTTPVTLSWNDLADDEGYRIYRSDDGATAVAIDDTAADVITYDDHTALHGVKHVYHVVKLVAATETADRSNPATAEYVRLLRPNGGETWTLGEIENIQWECDLEPGTTHEWELAVTVGGGSPHVVCYASTGPNPFGWKVGYEIDGAAVPNRNQFVFGDQLNNCSVRIGYYGMPPAHLVDCSDAAFSIDVP